MTYVAVAGIDSSLPDSSLDHDALTPSISGLNGDLSRVFVRFRDAEEGAKDAQGRREGSPRIALIANF